MEIVNALPGRLKFHLVEMISWYTGSVQLPNNEPDRVVFQSELHR